MSDKPYVEPICILCDHRAIVMIRCPAGCTCLGNEYQPRCEHHLMRLEDTYRGKYEIVEDYRRYPDASGDDGGNCI